MNEFVNTSQIEPLSVSGSVLIFGVPALAYFIAFHFGMPRLIKRGVKPFFAYCVSMGIPSFGLMTASILVYLHEGNPFEWNSLLVRFNYHEMNGNDWLWRLLSPLLSAPLALPEAGRSVVQKPRLPIA